MTRIWFKLVRNQKILQDLVIEVKKKKNKKDMIVGALEEVCMAFNLQKPMWFSDVEKDLTQFGRASFKQVHFIEEIDFDYLEFEIIEDEE